MATRVQVSPGLAGQAVRISEPGDEFFGGRVVRWGTLQAITDTGLVIDGYHDSTGGTAFSARPENGHLVKWEHLLAIQRHYPGTCP